MMAVMVQIIAHRQTFKRCWLGMVTILNSGPYALDCLVRIAVELYTNGTKLQPVEEYYIYGCKSTYVE